jgi:hypothetical protein
VDFGPTGFVLRSTHTNHQARLAVAKPTFHVGEKLKQPPDLSTHLLRHGLSKPCLFHNIATQVACAEKGHCKLSPDVLELSIRNESAIAYDSGRAFGIARASGTDSARRLSARHLAESASLSQSTYGAAQGESATSSFFQQCR